MHVHFIYKLLNIYIEVILPDQNLIHAEGALTVDDK